MLRGIKIRRRDARAAIDKGGHILPVTAKPLGSDQERLTLVCPSSTHFLFGLRDFWEHRYLVYVLVWRDLKARYKQTALGAAWAVLQPLLTMMVFTFVFGRLAKVPSGGVPYPVFVLCGLLPWQFFAQGLVRSGNSLVQERYLLTRVFVPRLIVPVSAILSGLPDFCVASAALFGIMMFYRVAPTPALVTLLPFLALVVATALCVGLFLSALNVRYRDVGYTVPFFAQLWFFVTPIAYPSTLVPWKWRFLYALNPMTGAVEGFRWALLGNTRTPWASITNSVVGVGILLVLALLYFQRMERTFADMV